jgi:hypothetical protein
MSDLSDCLNAVNEKTAYTYNKKHCSGFMLAMWLSHDPGLIGICNKINPYIFNLPDELIYKYFRKNVPSKKRYLKWTKKIGIGIEKDSEIQEFMDKYDVSSREAMLSIRRLK